MKIKCSCGNESDLEDMKKDLDYCYGVGIVLKIHCRFCQTWHKFTVKELQANEQ